ncbi:MAG: carboxylesterase family protein [Planctomycetota bacterium]|jgi:hypothetical protein
MTRRTLLLWLGASALVGHLAAAPCRAGGKFDPRRLPPLYRYIDETDDANAEKKLEKLLKKYGSPSKCKSLLKSLRRGRPYLAGLSKRETVKHTCTDNLERDFTYVIPSKYNPRRKSGLLIFLHGGVSQGPPGCGPMSAGSSGSAVRQLNFIVIAPSTYNKHEWGEPANRALIFLALEHVKQRYNVDENRVYISGTSDGSRGTFALVETHATFYAAAVPNIGAPGGATRFGNYRTLPWFIINGDQDGLFKIDRVKEYIDGMKAMGVNLVWKVIKGGGHNAGFFTQYKDDICDFLSKHERDPLPKTVDWQVDPSKGEYENGFPGNTFRWIRIDETGQAQSNAEFKDANQKLIRGNLPRIRATAEGNRVNIETSRVKKYTVLVSDKMFDLKKEIEILTNGKTAFKGKVENDARAILEEARRFNDRELVFNNRIPIDVDAATEEKKED